MMMETRYAPGMVYNETSARIKPSSGFIWGEGELGSVIRQMGLIIRTP